MPERSQSGSSRPQIFLPVVGAFDNIGDAMLRRTLLEWLRPLGTLHLYVGGAPETFLDGLGVTATDRVHRSFAGWSATCIRSAARAPILYLSKPGEIQLTARGMLEHVATAPLIVWTRLTGGRVARVGAGARGHSRAWALPLRPLVALAHVSAWREPDVARLFGRGQRVMPDLAFASGRGGADDPTAARDTVVVSLRGDRPAPQDSLLTALAGHAAGHGLTVTVVVQVASDQDRAESIVAATGAALLGWDADFPRHEDALRAVYRRAAVVVSDRLHVLIAAVTEGAAPVSPISSGSGKVRRHLEAAGFDSLPYPVETGWTGLASSVDAALHAREAVPDRLRTATDRLRRVRDDLVALVPGGPSRPTYLGRS